MAPSLAPLLDLPGVRDAVDQAREAVDQALRHAALRRSGGAVAAELSLRSAVASAALEGHRYPLEEVRSGTVTDPVVQGALRVSAALDELSPRWRSAPRQVLARLHVLAATGCPGVSPDELGRPLAAPEMVARLDLLTDVIATASGEVPAVIRAAVVHGELLAVRPFAGPGGVVARAAGRLTLIADGMDPRGLLAPEVAHLALEPEYIGTVNAFTAGTADGVRSWLRHCAAAVAEAAQELARVADTATTSAGLPVRR